MTTSGGHDRDHRRDSADRASRSCSATRPTRLLNHAVRDDRRIRACTCRARTSSTASFVDTDRNPHVLRNLQWLFDHGRLGGTGYSSILPVDQGIEHSGGASFAPNPQYFDPENIVKLAIEGGCNAVASTFGVLGAVVAQVRAQDPVHREAQPQRAADLPEQVRPDHVRHGRSRPATWARPASARRSTSAPTRATARSSRSPQAFEEAHELGMFTVLWCYLRNPAFKQGRRRLPRCPPTSPARPTTSA